MYPIYADSTAPRRNFRLLALGAMTFALAGCAGAPNAGSVAEVPLGVVPGVRSGAAPLLRHVQPASKLGGYEFFIAPEPNNSVNANLITGPDSNFYYGSEDASGQGVVVQFQQSGIYQTYAIPKSAGGFVPDPTTFVNGPDNRIWFGTYDCIIEAMTTSGSFQQYVVNQNYNCTTNVGSYVGQNIWFTLQDGNGLGNHAVGYINSGGGMTLFRVLTGQDAALGQITLGPDGNMWFGYYLAGATAGGLGRVTPTGKVKLFPLPASQAILVSSVITGPDGALWFCGDASGNAVGRMSTSGRVLSETYVHGVTYQMTVGSDGKVWVTGVTGTDNSYGLARFTSATRYQFLAMSHDPLDDSWAITTGPDKNMWFTTYSPGGRLDGKEMGTFVFSQPPNKR